MAVTVLVGAALVGTPHGYAQQQPAQQTKPAPAKPAAFARITSFTFRPTDTSAVVLGSPLTGEFTIGFEAVDGYDSEARAEIQKLVGNLGYTVNGQAIARAAASVSSNEWRPATSKGTVTGTVVFTLYPKSIGASEFSIIWGETQQIGLLGPDGQASTFAPVVVRSPLLTLIGVPTALLLVFACLVWAAWRWRLPERLFRRPLRPSPSTPPSSGKVVASGTLVTPGSTTVYGPFRPLPFPDVPPALIDAFSDNRAVLVLGAGASAEGGIPTGHALLTELLIRLETRLPPDITQSIGITGGNLLQDGVLPRGMFGKIIEAVSSVVPRTIIVDEIRDILTRTTTNPGLQRQLAELPWASAIALTWDTLAEEAFLGPRSARNGGWSTFTLEDSSALPTALRRGDHLFLRPLGGFDGPSSFCLSMEEFRRNLVRWPEFQRQLALMLQTQNFLFLGVGTDTLEQFLQAVGTDIQVGGERHFALVPDRPDNALVGATLRRFGVTLLPYTGRYGAISEFSDNLAAKVRQAPTQPRGPRSRSKELATSRIMGVKLTNIGLFESLDLEFTTDPLEGTKEAPWTVIFGPNGCGKSSILRAIGLALCGHDTPQETASRLLRVGSFEGTIDVVFTTQGSIGPQMWRTHLSRGRNNDVMMSTQDSPVGAGLILVLGFPALRGAPTANPRGAARLEERGPEPADLLPMVNGEVDHRLGSFKQWLVNILEQAGRRDRRALAMKALLDEIIRDVVPGEFQRLAPLDNSYVIKVKTDDSEHASPDDVPFDDLSQGMTSIFNWLGVLARRLYDFYPDLDEPESGHAVVMVDEIDAHLHPDWQRRLVQLAKKFFPNVQVLATSHSPLLAGALRGAELCVLERHPLTKVVRPIEITIDPYGWRSQQILTSSLFGLVSDRNPDLEQRIRRHVDLVQTLNPTAAQKKQLADLTEELQAFGYAGAQPSFDVAPPSAEQKEKLQAFFSTAADRPDATMAAKEGGAS